MIAETNVALKILPKAFSEDKVAVINLKQEYQRLINHLIHPNILQYRDLDKDSESGRWFIVMDYVEGKNLRTLLIKKRYLSLDEVTSILRPVAQAVDFSHSKGIVHCDLKPENIMIRSDNRVFLADFGLACEIQTNLLSRNDFGNDIEGTLPYMSPEQYEGKQIEPATDIWALGIILYEMIEGIHPFVGESFEHFKSIICQENVVLSAKNMSSSQLEILTRLISKSPAKRPVKAEKAILEIVEVDKPKIYQEYKKEITIEESDSVVFSSTKEYHFEHDDFLFLGKHKYSCGLVSNEIEEYRHKETNIKFSLIPAGNFMMGSNNGEYNEKPIHRVNIQQFLMSQYLITQKQWVKFMDKNPSHFKGENLPVEQVSWYTVKEFCSKTGLRLPSEAEWEYACRAGTNSEYFWGNDVHSSIYAHYSEKEWEGSTIRVGDRKPNSFGLYDMSGNTWEWCEDGWHHDYEGAPLDGAPWDSLNPFRVFRGGCWALGALYMRSTTRCKNSPDYSCLNLGFRLAFDAMEQIPSSQT